MGDDVRRRLFLARRWLEHARKRLWFIPAITLLLTLLLFPATYLIDLRLVENPTPANPLVQALFFAGSPDAARSVLAAIAGAWTTIMGVVFSITMVVLQLASSKYTSQLIPRFEQDRITQVTLASYIGIVAYSLLLLRSVQSGTESDPTFIPFIGINIALGWALLSLALTVAFIAHLSDRMQPIGLIQGITRDGIRALEALTASTEFEWLRVADGSRLSPPEDPEQSLEVTAPDDGYVQALAWDRLFTVVRDVLREQGGSAQLQIELRKTIDDEIREGDALARITGDGAGDESAKMLADWIRAIYQIDRERSIAYDPAYAVDELVNIGIKAMVTGDVDVTNEVLRGLARFYLAVTHQQTPEALLEIVQGEGRALFSLPYPDLQGQLLRAVSRLSARAIGRGYITVLETLFWESATLVDQLMVCHLVAVSRDDDSVDASHTASARCPGESTPRRLEQALEPLLGTLEGIYNDALDKVDPDELGRFTRQWIDGTSESVRLDAPLVPRWIEFLDARAATLHTQNPGVDLAQLRTALNALKEKSTPDTT